MSRIVDINGAAVMLDNDVADEIERLRSSLEDSLCESERLRAELAGKDARIAEVIDKSLLLFSKHERLKERIRRALDGEEVANAPPAAVTGG